MFDVRTMEGQSRIMHLLRTQKLPQNYLLTPDTHTKKRLFFGIFCAPANGMDDALCLIYY